MYIDETYKGRIRIEGKPYELTGYHLTVHDLDTEVQIANVCAVTIFLCPGELNRADVIYHKYGKDGAIRVRPDCVFEPMVGTLHIDNPEIALSAYERMQGDV